MKLLFDQNLSPNLTKLLADIFPDSTHVQFVGLDCADDDEIWRFAQKNGFTIVTKDEDYADLSVLRGSPPKVVWLQIGNCTTTQVADALRGRFADIDEFGKDQTIGSMVLS